MNVRDFDWGASAKYLWDATIAVVGDRDGDKRADTTTINTFYRPDARKWAWDKSAAYERSSVEFLSSYLWPYPWPQMTALEGPVSCSGMEYPMLTCIGGPRDTLSLYSVQVHETGHMWFPMQVGSNERRFAWQDEGLTRFNQAQGMQAFFKGYDREKLARDAICRSRGRDDEQPLMTEGDLYATRANAYQIATYDKMATNMVALRGLLGDSAFRQAIARTGCAGSRSIRRRMTSLIASTRSAGRTSRGSGARGGTRRGRSIRRSGRRTRRRRQAGGDDRGSRAGADAGAAGDHARGRSRRAADDAGRRVAQRRAGRRRVSIDGGESVVKVEIDPENVFPDVDRSNNVWKQ